MNHKFSPTALCAVAALLAAFGLALGYATSGPGAEAGQSGASGPCDTNIRVTSVERVEVKTLKEVFRVKWNANSPCVTEFEVIVAVTRKDNTNRSGSVTVSGRERSALVEVPGSRQDNLTKTARAIVKARGPLAGSGSLSVSGTSGVATASNAPPVLVDLSGKVTDSQGAAIPGVKIIFSPGPGTGQLIGGEMPRPTQTNVNGVWSQSGFNSRASVRVTPEKPGFTFNPASRIVTLANFGGKIDFTSLQAQTFAISGRVRFGDQSGGAGIADATITFRHINNIPGQRPNIPAPVRSDANGNWSQSGFTTGFHYEAAVSKPGLLFKVSKFIVEGPASDLTFIR